MTPREQIEKFLEDTYDARLLSQKCRDYFDHKQWTAEEESKLRDRKQAPIVVNRVKPKVEGLVGVYELRKTKPKAFPRTQKHVKAASAATDALRYVCDNTKFQMSRLDVAEDFFVEGYAGVIVEVKKKKGEPEIWINQIPWDRIYFDPQSRRKDFKDARYMGILAWLHIDVIKEMAGKSVNEDKLVQDELMETSEDERVLWSNKTKNMYRVALHFEIKKGKWKMSLVSGDYEILTEKDSPYLDEDGLPSNPIELVCANIDRRNQRYGEVAGFLSQQDEINHRRSKFLHLNSTRQTFGNDNAIQDVGAAKKELSKPDGHLKINGDAEFGKDFGILPVGDFSQAQFNLYKDAKEELDRSSFNAPMGGDASGRDLSGVALDKLQQAGTLELNRQYALLSAWENRVYVQVWNRVRQYWTEEKWIRVTDDRENLRWVGLNAEITAQQMFEEAIADKSLPMKERQAYKQTLDLLVQTQNPRLQEIVESRNQVAELDVDIIIDKSIDSVNAQQEQFEFIMQYSVDGEMDIIDKLELSTIAGKDELIEKIKRRRQEQQEAQAQAIAEEKQLANAERITKIRKESADIDLTAATVADTQMGTVTKQLENIILATSPPDQKPQVSA